MNKWKKKYLRLRDAAMCRHSWPYLHVESDTGLVYWRQSHDCKDGECPFLEALQDDR